MSDRVVHFEIPADDLERAQRFYRDAFGWSMNAMPGMGYVLVGTTPVGKDQRPSEPGSINGGLLRRQDAIRNVVVTIQVADIDASLEKVRAGGGRVVREKRTVGAMGSAAYVEDPEGNVVGLFQVKTS